MFSYMVLFRRKWASQIEASPQNVLQHRVQADEPCGGRIENAHNLQKLVKKACRNSLGICVKEQGKRNNLPDSSGDVSWHLLQDDGNPYHSLCKHRYLSYEFLFQGSGLVSLYQVKYWMDLCCVTCWVMKMKHQLPLLLCWMCLSRGCWSQPQEREEQGMQQGGFCGAQRPQAATSIPHKQTRSQYWPLILLVLWAAALGFLFFWCFFPLEQEFVLGSFVPLFIVFHTEFL